MTSGESSIMQVKAQIQQHLVESGSYELISNNLSQRLLQEGWTDQVKSLAREEISNDTSATFTQILAKVEPKASELVSESTKQEILEKIRGFLKEIVDTE
ncbi:LAME_0E05512g1_1 [Lachancea meyersii CBS 8951]|uniref:Transcription and mRNA export factor SUS1 n=1 Tax=Lachancea meyersii CBS 8951 TaxID=1266667 RepID=A0A1G4JHS4_9SACH|nr:LAME_0E05512g1_1 [Lachancea meyersii CBS 8951]